MFVNELRAPSTTSPTGLRKHLLTWALVGMIADDVDPCEAAEAIWKAADVLN